MPGSTMCSAISVQRSNPTHQDCYCSAAHPAWGGTVTFQRATDPTHGLIHAVRYLSSRAAGYRTFGAPDPSMGKAGGEQLFGTTSPKTGRYGANTSRFLHPVAPTCPPPKERKAPITPPPQPKGVKRVCGDSGRVTSSTGAPCRRFKIGAPDSRGVGGVTTTKPKYVHPLSTLNTITPQISEISCSWP